MNQSQPLKTSKFTIKGMQLQIFDHHHPHTIYSSNYTSLHVEAMAIYLNMLLFYYALYISV